MKVRGACLCGAIAYEAQIDPARVTICHCVDCQVLSGAPFRASTPANAEQFTILRGRPAVYVKTAESGNRRAQGFCGACGSALYSADAIEPKVYNLRIGAMAERERLPPTREIWCGSALGWTRDLLKVEKTQKQ